MECEFLSKICIYMLRQFEMSYFSISVQNLLYQVVWFVLFNAVSIFALSNILIYSVAFNSTHSMLRQAT